MRITRICPPNRIVGTGRLIAAKHPLLWRLLRDSRLMNW
nr:MAG TPA: hypothetical protein [Inoviridae sp.]